MKVFHGGHFGTRPVEVVMETIAFLVECLNSHSESVNGTIEDIDDSLSELPTIATRTPNTMTHILTTPLRKSKSLSSLRNYYN